MILFEVGGARCALPRPAVRVLLPLPRLARPPSLPAPLEGFLNLAGAAVAVIALARLFGLAETAVDPIYRHLVLVSGPASPRPIALLVDRALDLLTVSPGDLLPADPADSLAGCVEARIEAPGGPIHVLSLDRLLLAEERTRLAALTAAAQERLESWAT